MFLDNSSLIIPMPATEPAKGQLLSAKESRKRADEAVDNAITKELQEIVVKINAAAKEGKYSYSEDGYLEPEIKARLKSLGYKVDEVGSQYNQSYYSISW